MKFYSLLMLLTSAPAWSQDEQAIQQWQSQHPTTFLISSARLAQLSDEERQLLGDDIVVFQDEITLDQLHQYSAGKSGATAESPIKEADAQFIKDWLGTHQEVMIIRQSEFLTMTPEGRETAAGFQALVLEGEVVTMNDILHYPY